MLATMIQAVGLFVATNIDDATWLSLFFALVARREEPRDASSWVSTWDSWHPWRGSPDYLGREPGPAGIRHPLTSDPALGPRRMGGGGGEDDDGTDDRKKVAPLTVAAVTFANGGDNIGVYVPVFLSVIQPAS